MNELFTNIPDKNKKMIEFMIDNSLDFKNISKNMNDLTDFRNNCSDIEKDFMDFYFNLKLEKMKNENNIDKW